VAGTYLPVADAAGVVVDTTTYDDTLKGSGKLATLVFPTDAGLLAIAMEGDAFPRLIMGADPTNFGALVLGNGTFDAANDGGALISIGIAGQLKLSAAGDEPIFLASPPVIITHAAPADAVLNPGNAALWFDQTNGASKLMVKAMSANGTVVTGSVPLA